MILSRLRPQVLSQFVEALLKEPTLLLEVASPCSDRAIIGGQISYRFIIHIHDALRGKEARQLMEQTSLDCERIEIVDRLLQGSLKVPE